MQDQINQLKKQIEELKVQLEAMQRCKDYIFLGNLDDAKIERVQNTILTGTPADNTILRTATTTGGDTVEVLDYPERLLIYKWKGQRLVIPVYDADKILYP